MGATLHGTRVGQLPTGTHGSTFGGNPLACAVALAVLDVLESEHLPDRAARLGEQFFARLRKTNLGLVREVRGLGLMIGIELKQKVTPILQKLQERGVLALPAGKTVLRLLPPLVIHRDEWEEVGTTVIDVLKDISN